MKLLGAGLSVGLLLTVFVALPLFLLSSFIMPELQAMQQLYGNLDQLSAHVTAKH